MDQANVLRDLVERRLAEGPVVTSRGEEPPADGPRARTIAVTSGKGGVGKSHVALNLAVALAKADQRVCLLDGNLGLGSLELLSGLNGYWNLSHVVSGARSLSSIVLEGPAGIHVVPGASGLVELADCTPAVQHEIFGQLDALECGHDFVVLDTGAGIHHTVRNFLAAADSVLVVTTPEATAIADAYAVVKALSAVHDLDIEILVNQAASAEQARAVIERIQHTARAFLRREVTSAGFVPYDDLVPSAVFTRTPFVLGDPTAPASRAVAQLARRARNVAHLRRSRGPFFAAIRQRFSRRAA